MLTAASSAPFLSAESTGWILQLFTSFFCLINHFALFQIMYLFWPVWTTEPLEIDGQVVSFVHYVPGRVFVLASLSLLCFASRNKNLLLQPVATFFGSSCYFLCWLASHLLTVLEMLGHFASVLIQFFRNGPSFDYIRDIISLQTELKLDSNSMSLLLGTKLFISNICIFLTFPLMISPSCCIMPNTHSGYTVWTPCLRETSGSYNETSWKN